MQTVLKPLKAHAVDHISHTSLFQEKFGCSFGYTACAHIKHLHLVELTRGCAMATFHVVVVDFELGLRKHSCRIGGDDVAVALISLSLFGTGIYEDKSGEGSTAESSTTYLKSSSVVQSGVACTIFE